MMVVTRDCGDSDVAIEEVWVSMKVLGRAMIELVYC